MLDEDDLSLGSRPATLRSRALRGSFWATSHYGVSVLIRLGTNLVLARLLFPEAFGLMALVNAVVAGLHMFSDVGTLTSVIQSRRGDDPVFLDTVWTVKVVRGACLWFASCLLAFPLASIYEQPQLLQLIPIAGLSALISGFNAMSLPLLRRHMQLGKLAAVELATAGLCAILGVHLGLLFVFSLLVISWIPS